MPEGADKGGRGWGWVCLGLLALLVLYVLSVGPAALANLPEPERRAFSRISRIAVASCVTALWASVTST